MDTVIIYAVMLRFTDIGFTTIFTTLALYVLVFLYMCWYFYVLVCVSEQAVF